MAVAVMSYGHEKETIWANVDLIPHAPERAAPYLFSNISVQGGNDSPLVLQK